MKLIYIYFGGSKKYSSVQNKIINQIKELNNNGIDTQGWFFSESNEIEEYLNEYVVLKPIIKSGKTSFLFSSYYRKKHMHQQVFNQIKKSNFDLLFIRHFGYSSIYFKLLRCFGKQIVLYIPSNPVSEAFQERKVNNSISFLSGFLKWFEYLFFIYLPHKYLYKFIFFKIKAIVAYTPEFCNLLDKYSNYKSKFIYNRDGIDVSGIPIRKPILIDEQVYKLIFLKGSSTQQPWSGLDRLIKSIKACSDIRFHLYICGKIIDKENYNYDFVTLTGTLLGEKLNNLINNVDLGVSNLANYLIGFNETTNMKSREYFARGLPFIQANKMPDVDKTEASKYYLRIENNDKLINMHDVKEFIDRMRLEKNHPEMMRRFASENLDWKITVKELAESIKVLDIKSDIY